MYDYSCSLNPQRALIWRIVHRDNIPWVLDNGLHCGNSNSLSPDWTHIGSAELIAKRAGHGVNVGPAGVLNDYVPFYFTPFSPMMRNIRSGRGGITRRSNDDIVILVSSLYRLQELGIPFVFSDAHAYYAWSSFYTEVADLNKVDWPLLQRRDFKRDPDDPVKFERYQAEALVHKRCPVEALLGIICYSEAVKTGLDACLHERNLELQVIARREWYFL